MLIDLHFFKFSVHKLQEIKEIKHRYFCLHFKQDRFTTCFKTRRTHHCKLSFITLYNSEGHLIPFKNYLLSASANTLKLCTPKYTFILLRLTLFRVTLNSLALCFTNYLGRYYLVYLFFVHVILSSESVM